MIKKRAVIYFDDRSDNPQWFVLQLIFIETGRRPFRPPNPTEESKKMAEVEAWLLDLTLSRTDFPWQKLN